MTKPVCVVCGGSGYLGKTDTTAVYEYNIRIIACPACNEVKEKEPADSKKLEWMENFVKGLKENINYLQEHNTDLRKQLAAAEEAYKQMQKDCRNLTEKVITNICAKCDEAEIENERLRKNAERYRWLRIALADRTSNGKSHWFCCIQTSEELDKEIDAARAEVKS